MESSQPKCRTCGKFFTPPAGRVSAEFIEEESVRCGRLREIAQQRQALSLRLQGGIVGMLGSDTVDTIDMVAHRKSLAQLDATLAAEAQQLTVTMVHKPDGA